MSFGFSTNQFEDGFRANRLLNYHVPRKYHKYPKTRTGFSQFNSTERGHLLPGIPRSAESPWGTFMGTWDMPTKVPPPNPKFTARVPKQRRQLKRWKNDSILNEAGNGFLPFPTPQKVLEERSSTRPSHPSPLHCNSSGCKVIDDEYNDVVAGLAGRPGYTPGPNHAYAVKSPSHHSRPLPPLSPMSPSDASKNRSQRKVGLPSVRPSVASTRGFSRAVSYSRQSGNDDYCNRNITPASRPHTNCKLPPLLFA